MLAVFSKNPFLVADKRGKQEIRNRRVIEEDESFLT
jgi:hypothetical protein